MSDVQRRRITRACDFCHQRGLKCIQTSVLSTESKFEGCNTCYQYKVPCTTVRPMKQRGRPPKSTAAFAHTIVTSQQCPLSSREDDAAPVLAEKANPNDNLHHLSRVYLDVIHPNYPFLDEQDIEVVTQPKTYSCVDSQQTLRLAFYALSTLAVFMNAGCTSSACANDILQVDHATYFYEAISQIPFRIQQCKEFNYIKIFGLLALYSLRVCNFSSLHRYLALYHALVAQEGFHDERRWRNSLTDQEIECRRRLFWCMYRLEIHSACILGHLVRLPESQIAVAYPVDSGLSTAIHRNGDPCNVMKGQQNYMIDIFRLLEHSLSSMRSAPTTRSLLPSASFFLPPQEIMRIFLQMRQQKPVCDGKSAPDVAAETTGGLPVNIACSLQHMQIVFSEFLLCIMLLTQVHASATQIAREVEHYVDMISSIRLSVIRLGDVSAIQQLAGVGHLLFGVSQFYEVIDRAEVKRAIMCVIDLLNVLNAEVNPASDVAVIISDMCRMVSIED